MNCSSKLMIWQATTTDSLGTRLYHIIDCILLIMCNDLSSFLLYFKSYMALENCKLISACDSWNFNLVSTVNTGHVMNRSLDLHTECWWIIEACVQKLIWSSLHILIQHWDPFGKFACQNCHFYFITHFSLKKINISIGFLKICDETDV